MFTPTMKMILNGIHIVNKIWLTFCIGYLISHLFILYLCYILGSVEHILHDSKVNSNLIIQILPINWVILYYLALYKNNIIVLYQDVYNLSHPFYECVWNFSYDPVYDRFIIVCNYIYFIWEIPIFEKYSQTSLNNYALTKFLQRNKYNHRALQTGHKQ